MRHLEKSDSIKRFFSLIAMSLCTLLGTAQTNPSAQSLPYSQNFGTSAFSTLPAGFAAWTVSSPPMSSQSSAEASTPNGDATVTSATSVQTTGGIYGYATSSNARFYVQASSNATNGSNQFALAINTTGKTAITVAYDIEMISANPRTIGVELQYRVGTSGSWTAVSSSVYAHNSSDRSNGNIDNFTGLTLPTAAENQSVVQLRWAIWRGTESGNSSGLALDNVSITGSTGQASGYFRSATSGNWNATSTWQASADNSTWVSATVVPDYNANTITVQSGHIVTITASVTIDQTVVNGTLVYGDYSGSTITINDGTGTDLTINGTYQDIGPNSNTWSGSSTWSIGSSGTLLRTRATSSDNWRDKYQGGISTIPSAATWLIRKTGTDNPLVSSTGGMYYPNLTIENTSGSAWVASGNSVFTGSSDYPRITGNLDVGGAGTSAVTFSTGNTNATAVLVQGNVTVRSGSTLQNAGTGFELKGNLQVDGALNYSGSSSRNLIFSSSTAQTLSGAGTFSIYSLTLNKSSNTLTLNDAIGIDGTLTLTAGNIVSTSTYLLTINYAGSVSGASATSYVSGPVKKIGNASFTFPTGSSSDYQPLTITAPSNTTDAFTAQYFKTVQTDGSGTDVTISSLSTCEYWNLARTTGTSNVSVTLGWNSSSCNTTTPANMRIAYWNSSASRWNDEGGTGSTGTSTTGTITSGAALSTLGDLALANTTPPSSLYYRSTASGNWNSASTWQISTDNTNWFSATAAPDYNNNTITIQSAHTVTITASVTIDQTVVNGTLVYGDYSGSTLTINDGTGTDLTINGTYQDIGPNSNTWSGSSTWSMGSSGTLLRTRGTSSDNWRDKYQGGISTIPATATWLIRKTGTDNPLVSSTSGMYYPNLTIENTSGSAWVASGNSVFTGSSDYPRITGNLDVGGAGTSAVTFSTGNTNATAVLVQGNVTVRSGSTLQNAGTGFELKGNLQVDGAFNYSGSNSRNLIFSSSTAQTLSGAGTFSIYSLTIKKSSNTLTLNDAIGIDGTLTLTAGNIITTSTYVLTINNGGYVSGASAGSYVSGPVKKVGNAAFTFPTGNSSDYQPLTITAPSSSTDAFTAQYFKSAQADGTSTDATISSLSTCEYWNLARTTGTSNVSVTLGWNSSSCNAVTPANMRIALWNASASKWNDKGGISSTGNTTTGTITSSAALNAFGDLCLANKISPSALYYQSAATGNWDAASTWQTSADNVTWSAASSSPDYNNNTITVQSTHTVTIVTSVTIDQTVVNGTLIYGDYSGSTITINDGTGIDLTINGTYQDAGPNSNVWSGSATWSLGTSGTIVRSRGTSANNWRDTYDGGISTIPATANWILRKTGTDNPSMSSVGGMYYPNLTLENNTSSTWTSGAPAFIGSSDYPRVKGNLDVGGAGSNTLTFSNQNTNATLVPVTGNVLVRSGNTLQNNGTGFALGGNLQVDGTFNYVSGTSDQLIFNSAATQTISGSGTLSIYTLQVNKSVGTLTLNKAISIDNTLTLTAGNIVSTSTYLLTINNGCSVSGASTSSFVAGPVQKIGNAAFNFPVGKGTDFQILSITAPTSTTDAFTAEYFSAVQTDGAAYQYTLSNLSTCEYWHLSRNTGSSNVSVTLTWNSGSCLTTTPANMRVAYWNSTSAMWMNQGGTGSTGSSTAGSVTTASAQSSFGDFALAQVGTANVYFQSVQTGNWNATSTWNASVDNTIWQTALTTPDYNSNTITIQSAHTVTITASVTIDQTLVNGTLVYGNYAGSTLTLNDGTGTDLTINGTYQDIGPNSNVWSGSATWSLGTSGTIIRTRATSADLWRDHYASGISTIPATATWIVNKTGTDDPLLSSVGGMYYPNLIIQNNSGSAWTPSGSSIFTGSSDYPRILGTLDIGGTGTSTLVFTNQNSNATKIPVASDLIVRAGSTLQDNGTGFNEAANFQIYGTFNTATDLTAPGNITVGSVGLLYTANHNVLLGGNWLSSGTLTTGTGAIVFNGAGNQSVTRGSGTETFTNMTLNKSGGTVTLASPLLISYTLILIQGPLTTTATNILKLGNGGTAMGGSDLSYVSGPMDKLGNAAFIFPLGSTTLSTGAYHPLSISAPSATTDEYIAQYFPVEQAYGSSFASTLDRISSCDYWTMNHVTGSSSVSVTLNWNSNCSANGAGNDHVAVWNGSSWVDDGGTAETVSGLRGSITSVTNPTLSSTTPLLIASSGGYSGFVVLNKTLDGGYYLTKNNQLSFKYTEEYQDKDGLLTYNIYNSSRSSLISGSTAAKTDVIGDNRITVDISSLSAGYYILEVQNEKGETWKLRFKH